MKIDRIRVDAFGRLSALDTGPDSLAPLVVVLGPNEAGKSTLFSFLTTALYGFQPASRERNPHVPWGADEAGGSVWMSLAGAGCAEVVRKLRSAPSGTLTVGGKATALRNQPLPWVEHVPRTVFRQVFAITLSELAGLDEETWARIQDRVLGSMGASDLRPPRSVAEQLEREASEIWRPNRRGHQRLRSLQDDIRALRARRAEALARDEEIRALIEEGENLQVRLQEVRAERQRDRLEVERLQELIPLKKQLDRIAELRAEGGPRQEIAELPDDPRARVEALGSEVRNLDRRVAAIDRALESPEEALAAFGEAEETLLSKVDRVSAFLRRSAPLEAERVRAEELQNEVVDLEYRSRTAADHLVQGPFDEEVQRAMVSLSLDLLRDRVTRLAALSDAPRPIDSAGAGNRASDLRRFSIGAAGLGVAMVAWGLAGGPSVALTIGAALVAVGATLIIVALTSRQPDVTTAARSSSERIAALEREIRQILEPVPVRDEYLSPPGDPLVGAIERLQSLSRDWGERVRALQSARSSVSAVDDEAIELAASLGYPPPSDATELSSKLDNDLRHAERRRDAASRARSEIAGFVHERDVLVGELEDARTQLVTLEERLSPFATESGASGLEAAQRRVEAHLRADRLEVELGRSYPNLEELRARVYAMDDGRPSASSDTVDTATLKGRIDDFDAQIDGLTSRSGAIEREAAHLRAQETVDTVDGEVATLRADETRLIEERDRKWVIAQLLREADRRFREEHQPDLLRRASSYLKHLTGGRYDRLIVDEQNERDLFQLIGPELPAPIPLATPISTGTLEQAYLSLRLAIVDHLDQGNERLPLFIDEAFVNWDEERRDRGLEVLASLAPERQVFAFTCHPAMAEHLSKHGGQVVELGRNR